MQVLNPGLIGGLLLPILGALPDCAIILMSGIGGTVEEAQVNRFLTMDVCRCSVDKNDVVVCWQEKNLPRWTLLKILKLHEIRPLDLQ